MTTSSTKSKSQLTRYHHGPYDPVLQSNVTNEDTIYVFADGSKYVTVTEAGFFNKKTHI